LQTPKALCYWSFFISLPPNSKKQNNEQEN